MWYLDLDKEQGTQIYQNERGLSEFQPRCYNGDMNLKEKVHSGLFACNHESTIISYVDDDIKGAIPTCINDRVDRDI